MLVLVFAVSSKGVTLSCDLGTRVYVAGTHEAVGLVPVAHRELVRQRQGRLGPFALERLNRPPAPYADASAPLGPET